MYFMVLNFDYCIQLSIIHVYKCSFIHSGHFYSAPSTTTQRRSRLQHGYCIGVSRRSAQATAGFLLYMHTHVHYTTAYILILHKYITYKNILHPEYMHIHYIRTWLHVHHLNMHYMHAHMHLHIHVHACIHYMHNTCLNYMNILHVHIHTLHTLYLHALHSCIVYINISYTIKYIQWQWRRYQWGIGARAPSSVGNYVQSASVASLTIKISKITKEIHALNFHLSCQKHAKTNVNRLKQSQAGEEQKNSCCALTSFFLATPLLLAASGIYFLHSEWNKIDLTKPSLHVRNT